MELIHFYWEFKDKIECCSVFKGLNTVLLCSIVGMPVEMLSIVKEMGGTRGQNGSYSRWYGKPSECEISESGRKCDQNVSSIESNSGRPFCGTVFNIQRSDFFVDLVNESTGHVARLAQYEAWAIAADENPVKLGKCGNAGSSETWYGPGKTSSNYSAQKKKDLLRPLVLPFLTQLVAKVVWNGCRIWVCGENGGESEPGWRWLELKWLRQYRFYCHLLFGVMSAGI